MYKERAIEEMKKIFKDIPYGIEHTLKVLEHAEHIMEGENVSIDKRELISTVAVLHDIGAVEALHKYGSFDAEYQEKEGPIVAENILKDIGYDSESTKRACFIIGHHHTPSKIDDIDFQIQWEADFIENLLGSNVMSDKKQLKETIDRNFKTGTGRKRAYEIFLKNS